VSPTNTPRQHTTARRVAAGFAVLTLVLTTGSALAWGATNNVLGKITVDSGVSAVLGSSQPASQGYKAENILIVGSDTRTGQGAGYGNAAQTSSGNGQSDTTMLLHISADRKFAYAVSIPRDSWVTRPSCNPDGSSDGTLAKPGKFNEAFAVGGPNCIIRAVTYLTGIKPDHYVEVKLDGFKKIVDALGGVTICATKPLNDPIFHNASGWHGSGLHLPAGTSVMMGTQALAFVRARNLDATADVGRMNRQHAFISSIIRSATSSGLLTDPPRLYQVLTAVTSSLTVDSGLSGDNLKDFVLSLQGLSPSHITFTTVPNKPRGDGANLLWVTDQSNAIWAAMKADKPLPGSSAPTGQPALVTAPSSIHVKVLNATGVPGSARKAANQLQALGFIVTSVGNASGAPQATTSVSYDPGYNESSRTLGYAANTTVLTSQSGLGSTLVLYVGSNWKAPRAVVIKSASAAPTPASDSSCIN
jgi:LCP family protein required for cell wall assembly